MTYPENGQVSDATPIPALDSLKSNHPTLQGDYSAPLRYEEDGDDDQELLAEAIPLADTDDALMNGAVLPHRMVVVPIQGHTMSFVEFSKIISENAPKLHRVSSLRVRPLWLYVGG